MPYKNFIRDSKEVKDSTNITREQMKLVNKISRPFGIVIFDINHYVPTEPILSLEGYYKKGCLSTYKLEDLFKTWYENDEHIGRESFEIIFGVKTLEEFKKLGAEKVIEIIQSEDYMPEFEVNTMDNVIDFIDDEYHMPKEAIEKIKAILNNEPVEGLENINLDEEDEDLEEDDEDNFDNRKDKIINLVKEPNGTVYKGLSDHKEKYISIGIPAQVCIKVDDNKYLVGTLFDDNYKVLTKEEFLNDDLIKRSTYDNKYSSFEQLVKQNPKYSKYKKLEEILNDKSVKDSKKVKDADPRIREFKEFITHIYGGNCTLEGLNEEGAHISMYVPGELKRSEFESDIQEWCDEHNCSYELINQVPESPAPQYFSENMKLMYPTVKNYEMLAKQPRKLDIAKQLFKEQWGVEFDETNEDDREDLVLLYNQYMEELREWKPVELTLKLGKEEIKDSLELENDLSNLKEIAKSFINKLTNSEEKTIYKRLFDLTNKIINQGEDEISKAKEENEKVAKESICKKFQELSEFLNKLSSSAANDSAKTKLIALSKELYRAYDRNRKY